MFVKITGCAIPTYWYHKEIGTVHEVEETPLFESVDSYRVVGSITKGIQKLDCEIIEKVADAKTRVVVTFNDSLTEPEEVKNARHAQERKETPIFSGVLNYFPDALRAVAQASFTGQQQHNPDKPLAWDRSKSGDELDALTRHLLEAGTIDTDGVRHSTKVAWRALANLQKEIEQSKIK